MLKKDSSKDGNKNCLSGEKRVKKSLGKSSKHLDKCVICIENIKTGELAKLNGCDHTFCFECIDNWGTKCENKCPLCWNQFKEIIYHDEKGELIKKQIKELARNEFNETMICAECNLPVLEG